MHFGVFFLQIVTVVRRDEFYAYFSSEFYEIRQYFYLVGDAVVLYLDIEIALVEHTFEHKSVLFCFFVFVIQYILRYLARKTRAQTYESLGMFL